MTGKCSHLANMSAQLTGVVVSIALLGMVVSTAAFSQDYGDATGQGLTTTEEDHQRFEAERLRQQQLQYEIERRRQARMQLETERLRQENERREQERLRLENERLRQEIELSEQEKLRHEGEVRERERAQAAALRDQTKGTNQATDPDIFEQLQTIGQLRDDGILTEEEFQKLKKRILD